MINRIGELFAPRDDDDGPPTSIVCPTCKGEGEFLSLAGQLAGRLTPDATCPDCSGSGRVEP